MYKISEEEALALAQDASEIRGYGSWNSTGYQTIVEGGDKEFSVDIFKHNDNGQDYFAVGVTTDESSCEFSYTDTNSVDELTALILELAKDAERRCCP